MSYKKYTVKSRYGEERHFEFYDHGVYFVANTRWCRFGHNNAGKISFVDPDGGPFVSVGANLNEFGDDFPDFVIGEIVIRGDSTIELIERKS